MRKLLCCTACVLLLVCSFSFGQDFGASIENAFSLGADPTVSLSEAPKLSLWVRTPLGSYLTLFLQANTQIGVLYDAQEASSSLSYGVDIDSLQLSGAFPGLQQGLSELSFSLGRILVADATGLVFAHRLDGLSLGFAYRNASTSITFGSTGLLSKTGSAVIMSNTDLLFAAAEETLLAAPRFVGLFELTLPYIFGQTASLSLVFQEDLEDVRDENNLLITEGETEALPGLGGPLDTQYASVVVGGPIPIIPALYYDGFFTLGTGRVLSYIEEEASETGFAYRFTPIMAYMTGGGVRVYLEQVLSSAIGLRVVFSSGDEDHTTFIEGNTSENSTAFVPISRAGTGMVFAPQLSNIVLGELSYSLRPFSTFSNLMLQNVQSMLKAITFFRSTAGPISQPGIQPDSASLYLGTEVDVTLNFRPLSDLGASVAIGVFVPGVAPSGAFDPTFFGGSSLQYRANVNVSMSL